MAASYKVTLDTDNGPVDKAPFITQCLALLEGLRRVVALDKFEVVRSTGQGVSPAVYNYKIKALDGRQWLQVITFTSTGDPSMTFDVDPGWKLSEFRAQRDLRDVICAQVLPLTVTSFVVKWEAGQ